MTKKRKVLIISIIVAICAAITILVLWLFVFKSIKGEWYVDDPYAFFNKQDYTNMSEEEIESYKKFYETTAVEKYVFHDDSFDICRLNGTTISYYYKIEDEKLYYSKENSNFKADSFYTIVKHTNKELILKQSHSEDIVLIRK